MLRILLILLFGVGIAGCASHQAIPGRTYNVLVLDEETAQPIEGAHVRLVFDGMTRGFRTTPVLTDANGVAELQVPQQTLPLDFGVGYFAGGYFLKLVSRKTGYEEGSYSAGPNGFPPRQLVIKQKAISNPYGIIRLEAVSPTDPHPVTNLERVLFHLRVTDGPSAGEELILPFYASDFRRNPIGSRYYLKQLPAEYRQQLMADSSRTFFSLTDFRPLEED